MFRMWCKLFSENRLIADMTIENPAPVNRTKKVFDAIDEVCRAWDLSKPIWLETNIRDFKRHGKTRFNQDCFTERIEFDFLELQVIEED